MIGSMIAGSLSREFPKAFLIFEIEASLEIVVSLRVDRFVAPFLEGRSEDAGVFENGRRESDGYTVGDRFDGQSERLAVADAEPHVLDGIVGIPFGGEEVAIFLNVVGGHLAV